MIYYAHVNEDNRAEKTVMDRGKYDSLVSVCGSGERVIALLTHPSLSRVDVIDVNLEALYLLELKLTALSVLEVGEYLRFVGHHETIGQAVQAFKSFKDKLTPACRIYWEERTRDIEKGILNTGHFETFLSRIRPVFRRFLGPDFYALFEQPGHVMKSRTALIWKCIKAAFAMRSSYRLFGMRDTAFMAADTELSVIPQALQASIEERTLSDCFMAHLVFYGNLSTLKRDNIPPSLDPELLRSVKEVIRSGQLQIRYHHSDYLQAVENLPIHPGQAAFHSISDLLSFENMNYLYDLISRIKSKGEGKFTIVLRSFLRNRLSGKSLDPLGKMEVKTTDISRLDTTNMYQVFKIETSQHE